MPMATGARFEAVSRATIVLIALECDFTAAILLPVVAVQLLSVAVYGLSS